MKDVLKKFPGERFESTIEDSDFRFVTIDVDKSTITFKLQDGPIGEVGVNGCQIDTIIKSAQIILNDLNEKYSCIENDFAIISIAHCILWLKKRKVDREKRGVEGLSKP